MLKSDILAADFRDRAQQATATAQATPLPQVRLRHEAAAVVWLGLAAAQDQRTAHANQIAAPVRVRAESDAIAAAFPHRPQ